MIRRLVSASSRVLTGVLVFLVRSYQVALAPMLGGQCRYHPTCSEYAVEALERHGTLRGTVLAARRIGRCHPFRAGGFDPVPVSRGAVARPGAALTHPRGGSDGP